MKKVSQQKLSLPLAAFVIVAVAVAGYFIIHRSQAANADINADGKINATDLSIMAANYGKSGQTFAQGDVTGDGLVNIFDLSVLASNWGGGSTACVGVALVNGQSDINSHAAGTTYCMTGVHNNWTLSPKSNDKIIGDGTAVMDGTNTTQRALLPTGANVTISNIDVRNYKPPYQGAAIQGCYNSASCTGWILSNLQVHDNGIVCPTSSCGNTAGGYGASLGFNWQVIGGRYYNNRQSGLGAGAASGAVLDGVEIDHNNFTNSAYTTANNNCDDEAGGIKWAVTSSFTVKNSTVHDNACRGLWGDIENNNTVITNNNVYNNWADGIMFEISGGATITGNTSTGNAFKEFSGGTGACAWGYGAGIFISTSGKTAQVEGPIEIANNTVSGNCSSITGVDETRDGTQQLMHLRIHDNIVTGSTNPKARNMFGVFPSPGDPLTTHDIIFGPNTLSANIVNCGFTCN